MSPKKNSPGGCGCCCTTICSDNFNRDGTNVETGGPCATGFTIVSGSWTLTSGELQTSSTSAILKCADAASVNAMVVTVDIKGGSGDKIRVLVDHDGTHYHYAEVVIGTTQTLSLYDSAGTKLTSETLTTSASTYYTLVVYFNGTDVSVDGQKGNFAATCNGVTAKCCVTPHGGTYSAIGTGGTAASVAFKNFLLQPYQSNSNPGCPAITRQCCTIESDDFSVDDYSTAWRTDAGTASIASGFLSVTASNSTITATSTDHSGGVPVYVSGRLKGHNDNDEIKIIVKQKDSTGSDYWYMKAIIGTTKTLKLFKVVASVETELASTSLTTTAGTWYDFYLCFNASFVWGIVDAYSITTTGQSITNQTEAALGTGTITSQVDFDDYVYAHGYEVDRSPYCRRCTNGGCNGTTPPPCPSGYDNQYDVTFPDIFTNPAGGAYTGITGAGIGGTYTCGNVFSSNPCHLATINQGWCYQTTGFSFGTLTRTSDSATNNFDIFVKLLITCCPNAPYSTITVVISVTLLLQTQGAGWPSNPGMDWRTDCSDPYGETCYRTFSASTIETLGSQDGAWHIDTSSTTPATAINH